MLSVHPTHFDKLYFHFDLVQNIFKSLKISSWFHVLLRSVLFNLHIIWDFLVLFLLLLSSLITLWSERRFMISFLNLLRCVLSSSMCSILVNIPWDLEKKYILLLLDEVIYRCLLYSVDGWYFWVHLWPYWFSACWICPFTIQEYGKSPTIIQIHLLLLWLPLVFTSHILRPINTKDCYIILECWPPLIIM